MADILTRIYASKEHVRRRDEAAEPYESIRERALASRSQRRPFLQTLVAASGPAIIGEIKRASPSAGLIARNFDARATAHAYDAAGADCISVLTESDHFLGELVYLNVAREASSRPLLRKDFLSTPYEIAQSAAYGADAVLLIVAGLRDEALADCMNEARSYDLDVLVEVHDGAELERAQALGASLIGINNRNLHTFETDLAVSEMLLPSVKAGAVAISESGMQSAADILRLYGAGARGFLVGEALMRSEDPQRFIGGLKSALHATA